MRQKPPRVFHSRAHYLSSTNVTDVLSPLACYYNHNLLHKFLGPLISNVCTFKRKTSFHPLPECFPHLQQASEYVLGNFMIALFSLSSSLCASTLFLLSPITVDFTPILFDKSHKQ